jgi:hypothetical protein
MCAFTADLDRAAGSPDRVDALVWGASELMIAPMESYGIYELYRQQAEALSAPHIEQPDPWRLREDRILAERQRFADIMAARMPGLPTQDEITAHTIEIDRLIREGHRA